MSWQDFGKNFALGYAVGEKIESRQTRNELAKELKDYEALIDSVASGAVPTTEGDPYDMLAQKRTRLTELGIKSGMSPTEIKDFSLYASAAESRVQTKVGQRLLANWGSPDSLEDAKRFVRILAPSSKIDPAYSPDGELVVRSTDETGQESVIGFTQDKAQRMLELLNSDPVTFATQNRENIRLSLAEMQTRAGVAQTEAQTGAIIGQEGREDAAFPAEQDRLNATTTALRGGEARANALQPAAVRTAESNATEQEIRTGALPTALDAGNRAATAQASQEEARAGALPAALAADIEGTTARTEQTRAGTANMASPEQAARTNEAAAKAAEAEAEVAVFRAARTVASGGADPKLMEEAAKELNKYLSAPEYAFSMRQRPKTDPFRMMYEKNPTAALSLVSRIAERSVMAGKFRPVAELEALAVELYARNQTPTGDSK